MSYIISSSTLRGSFLRALVSCVLVVLFALGLSACVNRPEHAGPDASSGTVETTLAVKPPMNNALDEDASNGDSSSEADGTEEEQADSENTDASNDQDNQRQANSGSNATSSSGSSGTTSSSNAGSGSSGSGGSSGSSEGGSSSTSSGSGGQSSSGGGSSGSGQGSSQSGGSGNSGSGNSGSSSGNNSAQSPAPQTITVSIEICARLAHAADPAAVAGISNAGVILSRRNVTVPTGASVRQALDATGVRLNARGAYIAGIAGLSEGDLGPQSGWMFSVNGVFSSQSASAHRLNAGDVIAWRYTINGGADLGASW